MHNRLAHMLAWVGVGASVAGASAQWTTERWVSLVEMPVAVTRLEVAGVPLADLSLFVPALNVTEVQPVLFLETVRGVPVLQQYYVLDDYDVGVSGAHPVNHGGYVQYLLSRGLRGRALADAIHGDLGARGFAANRYRGRGVDVLRDDYVLVRIDGDPGLGLGRGQNGSPGRGRGADEANGRARSLGDDLRARKGGANNARPTLEPRGRGNSSVSPGNPGRGNGGGAGNGGNGRGGGNGGGGRGQGGGRGRGG